jgi:hypothetical protein
LKGTVALVNNFINSIWKLPEKDYSWRQGCSVAERLWRSFYFVTERFGIRFISFPGDWRPGMHRK